MRAVRLAARAIPPGAGRLGARAAQAACGATPRPARIWPWRALAPPGWIAAGPAPAVRRWLHEAGHCASDGKGNAAGGGAAEDTARDPPSGGDGKRLAVGRHLWGGISEHKIADLTRRVEALGLRAEDVHEEFIRGSGRGGQAVNKTASKVRFTHLPTGIQAVSQQV